MSVKSRGLAGRTRPPLVVEPLEDRVMLTLLTVLPDDQGAWTFHDADNQTIRLILSTGPNSGAQIDVYDQNGDNMVFDTIAGGVYGSVAGVFSSRTDLPAGTLPTSVAVGDFDGDGNLDIVATNKGSDNIAVYLGTGTGTFGAPTFFSVGDSPSAIAVGLFDADADLDLAVATRNTAGPDSGTRDYISILLGDGVGGFGAPTNFRVGVAPSSIAVGDWDGDGALDLAVACSLPWIDAKYYVWVLLGDGAGGFPDPDTPAAPGPLPSMVEVGNTPMSVVTGDFTEDGLLDLAVANMGADTVSVLSGTGTGAFSLIATNTVGSDPVALAVGQFNNDDAVAAINDDDYLDLVVVNKMSDNITVLYNDGADGTFPRSLTYTIGGVSGPTRPTSIVVGNFNNDAILDLAVANLNANTVSVFLGDGGTTGGFTAAAIRDYPVGAGPLWLAAGSFNTILPAGDTRTDLVVANSTSSPGTVTVLLTGGPQLDIGYIKILESDADTTLVINAYSQSDSEGTRVVTLELFSGDNDADTSFFATWDYSGDTAVRLAPPNGAVWIRGDIFTTADMNLDLVVVNYFDGLVSFFHGNGDGTFTFPAPTYSAGAGPISVAAGDFDNDGDLDLAIANSGGDDVGILLNDGTGVFGSSVGYFTGDEPSAVVAGDFNGDGNLDLVVANWADNNISLLLGNGDGTFGSPINFAVGLEPVALAVADFNSDTNLDVVSSNWGDGTATVLLGNGVGSFGAPIPSVVGLLPMGVAVGDFNGDATPDLVVAVFSDGTVSILLGNGDGTFGFATSYVAGPYPRGLAVGDFNEDGYPDVAVTTGDPFDSFRPYLPLRETLEPLILPSVFPNPEDADLFITPTTPYHETDFLWDGYVYPDGQPASGAPISSGISIEPSFPGFSWTGWGPPDPISAAGPSNIMAMVNSSIGIWSKTGTLVSATTLGLFYDEVAQDFGSPFDPWIFYDRYSGRYIAMAEEVEFGGDEANLLIAISTSSSPDDLDVLPGDLDNDWYVYRIPATYDFGGGLSWIDYPKIAADADSLYITGNYFRFSGSAFQGVLVTRLDKTPMLSGTLGTRVDVDASGAFTLQPAQSVGRSAAEPQLFVDSWSAYGVGISVWEMDDANSLSLVTTLVAPFAGYSGGAPQQGTSDTLDTVSVRLMNAVWRDNSLWTTHTVSVGGDATVRWYEIDTTGGTYTLVQTGDIDPGAGIHTFMPAIAVNAAGVMGITYTQSSSSQYPAMMFTGRLPGDPLGYTDPGVVIRTSSTYYNPSLSTVERWGDYGGLAVDPADDVTFWAFHEYAATTTAWGTWWAELLVSPARDFVTILLGDGTGGLGAPTNFPVGLTPMDVVLGDFNKDGHIDIAAANVDDDTVSVLLGNGAGGFPTSVLLSTGSGPLALAVGDFDVGRSQDFGTILIGGTFGVDDAHAADAPGGTGAADGVTNDNGAIRISGNIGRISVGFLAGTVRVEGNLGELTVEGNAGFIQDSSSDGNPDNEFYNAGPTFYNATIFVGGDLGYVRGGGDWAIPITVTGNAYGEAAQYTDAGAGARSSAAKIVRMNGEEFFQVVGTHSTGDGSDWYRFTAEEGEDIHIFAPAGVPVRLYKNLGAGLVAVTNTLGQFVDGYGYAPHNTNYVVPAGEQATYYLVTTWSYDDADFNGVDDVTAATGPRDPLSYDIFVGITGNIVYEQEVLGETEYYARKDAGRDDEATKPVSRGEFIVDDDTNNTPETAEFVPLPGTMVIHGVLQGGQDLDDTDDSSTRDDAYDNLDIYAIHVEAGTRIIAGLNYNFHNGVGSPVFSGYDEFAIKLGLLDEDGNVLDSSYELAATRLGGAVSPTGGYVNYLADHAGTYYLAVSFHEDDNNFDGDPGADYWDIYNVAYEIFVTGTSTHQVFGGFDIAGHLGTGPSAARGNINVLTQDLGWFRVGGNVYSPLVKVAGDLVHGQVGGNLGNEATSTEPWRTAILETDGNIHKFEAATLEDGYLDVGGDAYELYFSGSIGTEADGTWGMIFVAGSIGILDVTGTIYGNGWGGSGYRPSIVVDYDLAGPPGVIDYIHAANWGDVSAWYDGPAIIATGPGGNVRFVEVDGAVYFRNPATGDTQSIGVKNITSSSPAADLLIRDDSGAELRINLDVDGLADPWETPEENAPPATGSYQLIPIYGFTSPSLPDDMYWSGLSTLRFIGHAVDDFTLTGDQGSMVYLTESLGTIDISNLALGGDIRLTILGSGASVNIWEVTGGSEDSTLALLARGDIVGIQGDAFKSVRIYNGSLGFTHSLSGTQTGYKPGTFTGPVLIQRYEPQGDNPDLYVSGMQLEGDIGDLLVSDLIVDVEIGGSVTRGGAVDQFDQPVWSGVYHAIQPRWDGVSESYWLNGKVFEGLAGVIYVAGDVGVLDGALLEDEPMGGIFVGDGLPHSGHGNHPLTGIFVGGTVVKLYATGAGHDISGDVFIGQIGAQVTDNDPYDPKTWVIGGLILENGADLRDLEIHGGGSYDEAYDAYETRTSSGVLWRMQVSGANAEIWNTFIGYSSFNEVTITGGVGVHHAFWLMSELRSAILTGTETGIHDAWIVGDTLTRLEVAGWGFDSVDFNVSGNVVLVKTTNSSIGDFNDVDLMIGGRLLELSSAHDIIDMTLTTFQDAVLVKAARDVNGLVYQGTRLGRLEAGRNLYGLDLTVAGEIDWVKATTGGITGTRIAALGPSGRINHVIAQGKISVSDIRSDGTITEIKSLGGSIDPMRIRAWGSTVTTLWAALDIADVEVVAWNIGTVYAGRDIARSQFIAGYDSVTGQFVSGRISSVTVGRNLVDSDFAAGVHPGADGVFGTADDYGAVGTGTIGTFRVTGALLTSGPHAILADAGPFTVTRVSTGTSLVATNAVQFFPGTSYKVMVVDYVGTVVGAADVNGDGKSDVVGFSAEGAWWVGFSTASLSYKVMGLWSTALAWTDLRVADVNGDGRADVIGRTSAGQWWAGISTGTSFTDRFLGTWSSAVTWNDVQVADINRDGRDDVIGRTNTGAWWAGVSTGISFTNRFLGAWSTAVTWNDVRVADINADGRDDVIGRTSGGKWWAGLSTGTAFTNTFLGTWSTAVTWNNVRVADVNGDGRADVIGRTNTGAWYAGISTGSAFTNTFLGAWSTAVTWNNVLVADINGDGKDDVIGRTSGGQWWAGLSTGSAFTNKLLGTWSTALTWVDVQIGDMNGDNRDDVIARVSGTEHWWAGLATATPTFVNQQLS